MAARHRWTPTDDRRILEYVAAYGPDLVGLAAHTGFTYHAVQNRVSKQLAKRYKDASDSYYARRRAQEEVAPVRLPPKLAAAVQVPVPPFAVPVPKPPPAKRGRFTTAVLYGDTHYPFQDDAALRVVQGVVKDVRPNVLVHMGDLVDCWQVSRYDKNPNRLDTLQENIDAARVHLHQMAQLAPQARRVLLEGNHEARLQKTVWAMADRERELARLSDVRKALEWPNLLRLADIGFEWIGEREQSRADVLPKIIVKHGSVVRAESGATAQAEHKRYGRSGASGHTHRLGWYVRRDANGRANWVETGCTCDLQPEYGTDFNWAHGCVVMTWSQDQRLQNIEFVSIRDGRALWRDKEYGA